MVILLTLSILSAVAIAATLRSVFSDGYHRVPTDRTRLP
jgi:hypothetical protein